MPSKARRRGVFFHIPPPSSPKPGAFTLFTFLYFQNILKTTRHHPPSPVIILYMARKRTSQRPAPCASTKPQLLEAQDRFIASWGRMGSVWGISRTMAEVHALLYITGQPMCTDEIMDRLRVSRGNVSMSVRSLLEWAVIEKVRLPGRSQRILPSRARCLVDAPRHRPRTNQTRSRSAPRCPRRNRRTEPTDRFKTITRRCHRPPPTPRRQSATASGSSPPSPTSSQAPRGARAPNRRQAPRQSTRRTLHQARRQTNNQTHRVRK